MRHYIKLGVKVDSTYCIKKINDILSKNFDIGLSIEYYDVLNKENLKKFNDKYAQFLEFKNYASAKLDNINIKNTCCICLEDNVNIIKLYCNHPNDGVCYKCYPKITECPLCRDYIPKS